MTKSQSMITEHILKQSEHRQLEITIIILDEDFVVEEARQPELEFFASVKDKRLQAWRRLRDAVTEDNEHVTDAQVRLEHTQHNTSLTASHRLSYCHSIHTNKQPPAV